MTVTGLNEEQQEDTIDMNAVKFFGTEVKYNLRQDGEFKSFSITPWVKANSKKVYLPDHTITSLKQHFKNYTSEKRYHTKEKKGKLHKVTEWNCEVVEENTIQLQGEAKKNIETAKEKRRPFEYKNTVYLYIIETIFKDSSTNVYYHFDEEKGKLVGLGYTTFDYPSKDLLMEAIKKYQGEKKNARV